MPDLTITMQDATAAAVAAPGQMTRAEILSAAKSMMGRSGTDEDDLMVLLLNNIQQVLATYHDWSFLQHSVEGTLTEDEPDYDWPGGMNRITYLGLIGDEKRKLWPISGPHGNKLYPDLDEYPSSSIPTNYINRGTGFSLVPPPDDNYPYIVRGYRWPSDLSASTTTSDFRNMGMLLVNMLCMETSLALSLHTDYHVYRTAVFTNYPVKGGRTRGLLPQAIANDMKRVETNLQRRPFSVHDEDDEAWPPDYLSNPRVGLNE